MERLIELDAEDTTKQRQRAALLSLMDSVLEALPDGLVVTDVEGNVLLFNQKAEYMFGRHRSEVIGQKVEMLMPEGIRATHANHRQLFNHSDIGAHTRTMGLGRQLTGLRSDGNEFPADITLSRMVVPRGVINLALIRYSPQFLEQLALGINPAESQPELRSRNIGESNAGK